MLGAGEIVVIVVIALLVFGKDLPDVARKAGQAIAEFKKAFEETEDTKD